MTNFQRYALFFPFFCIYFGAACLMYWGYRKGRRIWGTDKPRPAPAPVMIGPATVVRGPCGEWSHPDIPKFDEDGVDLYLEWKEWVKAQCLEIRIDELQGEDMDHPVYESYFDHENPDYSKWVSKPPPGEGWFTLGIGETDDGPSWWWARRQGGAA